MKCFVQVNTVIARGQTRNWSEASLSGLCEDLQDSESLDLMPGWMLGDGISISGTTGSKDDYQLPILSQA